MRLCVGTAEIKAVPDRSKRLTTGPVRQHRARQNHGSTVVHVYALRTQSGSRDGYSDTQNAEANRLRSHDDLCLSTPEEIAV